MSKAFIFAFVFLNTSIVFCQDAFISTDSTRIIFPNNVAIKFLKAHRKTKTVFEFTPASMRTILLQHNFLSRTLLLSNERIQLLEGELVRKDSSFRILNEELKVTSERLLIYSSGYEALKSITTDYDNQNRQLLADVESIRKKNRSANRRRFFQGFAAGLMVTVIYVILHE